MKHWKRLAALALSGALALSLCACDLSGRPTTGEPTASPSVQPSVDPDPTPTIEVDLSQDALAFSAGLSGSDALLTINGTQLPADLVLYWLGMSCGNFTSQYGAFGLQLSDKPDPNAEGTFADLMVDSTASIAAYYTVLRQRAAELGCLPTDAQVQAARDALKQDGEDNYQLLKAAFGLSDETLEYLFLTDAYYDNVEAALIPTTTDEMLNSYVYQVKHILFKTVDDNRQPLPAEQIAEKKKQAEDTLAQLQQADDLAAEFDQLMNELSEDGRDESGALGAPDGYTAVPGEMVPEFEEASFALKPGELSGLVESDYGYHIILRGEVDDLQSYADDCRQYLLDQELNPLAEGAEVTWAPAMDTLDVADFYSKYAAYQNAVAAQHQSEAAPDPVESDGVG